MRTQAGGNVLTHMILARLPTSSVTRSRISAAALLVKVIARIEPGWALRSEINQAIRRASTRVLPDPAPATTSSGAPSWTTAARWGSLSPSSSSSRVGPRRLVRGSSGAGRPACCSGAGIGEVLMLVPTLRAAAPSADGVPPQPVHGGQGAARGQYDPCAGDQNTATAML